MPRYRAFRNSDPPHLAKLFRMLHHNNADGRITSTVLERLVFSKPYFDPQGLIVAESESGEILGCVHAGFGASDDGGDISHDLGVICILLVDPNADYRAVATELLKRAESYLRASGATVLYGGGVHPLDPFYVGICGSGESLGILSTNRELIDFFGSNGYRESQRSILFQCPLADFRAPVDRRQIAARRRCCVERREGNAVSDWWTACTRGAFDCARYELSSRSDGSVLGSSWIQDTSTVIPHGQERVVSVIDFEIDPRRRREGLGTFLLAEMLKDLKQSFDAIELQTMNHNVPAQEFYKKLGFTETNQGIVFRKE